MFARFLSPARAALAAAVLLAGCDSSITVETSGTTGDSGRSVTNSGGQHPACAQPAPSPMPEPPPVNESATGRPNFDLWRDADCDAALDHLCGAAGPGAACDESFDFCLASDPADGGVCTSGDSDFWCDGEGEALGFRDGECWMCAPIQSHAAACCTGLAGFDCRAWPYPADGKPGMVCAGHDDCESGLVCGGSNGKGFGICQCPGLDPDSVMPQPTCF